MAGGTEMGFEEFGRALEIVAQIICFKEPALDAGLPDSVGVLFVRMKLAKP